MTDQQEAQIMVPIAKVEEAVSGALQSYRRHHHLKGDRYVIPVHEMPAFWVEVDNRLRQSEGGANKQ